MAFDDLNIRRGSTSRSKNDNLKADERAETSGRDLQGAGFPSQYSTRFLAALTICGRPQPTINHPSKAPDVETGTVYEKLHLLPTLSRILPAVSNMFCLIL